MTTIEKKSTRDDGMLDIGRHCFICRELDFLPFVCPKCNKSYCNNHRSDFNSHQCVVDEQEKRLLNLENSRIDTSSLPKSSEVFPDLPKIRKEAELKHRQHQNNTIGQRLSSVKGSTTLTSVEVALLRLKKLLGNSKSGTKTSKTSAATRASSLLGRFTSPGNTSTAGRMVELNKLKRSAIGDSRVNVGDRVYVWVIYNSEDDTKFENKKAQYFSKKWPIGKMLDNSAELSNIKNLNNREIDSSLKLAMFRKVREGESDPNSDGFIYIPTNGRVSKEIKDGDEVYILRGHR